MPTLRADAVFNRIVKLVAIQDLDQRADAELVERFAQQRDEAAFETLLRRHGPMIVRLCRRLADNETDAEDVFQATFLVFARKAGSLRKSASVGSWLYGVANRLASKSRTGAQRRREKSKNVPLPPPTTDALSTLTVAEAERILHEELSRLPIRFRDPIIMCHLEGKTRDQAARALGCALGTLKDRLLRGKEMLRVRLNRRGVGIPAAMVAGLISETVNGAAVNQSLAQTVVQSATSGSSISASVATLVEWGIGGAGIAHSKLTAYVLAATILIGAGFGLSAIGPAAVQPANINAAVPIAPADETNKSDPRKKGFDALGDPLPDGAVMRLGTRRHRVQTYPMQWQPALDGKSYIALQRLNSKEEIRRIDAQTGLVLDTWPVPDRMNAVAFSPDGRYVLMNSHFIHFSGFRVGNQKEEQDCVLTLYDLLKREEVWSNHQKLEQKDWVNVDRCRFSNDGKWFLTTGQFDEGSVRLWDASTGVEKWNRKKGGQSFKLLGIGESNKVVVLRGGNDGDIYLVDRVTGKDLRSFKSMPLDEFPDCSLSPDGEFLLLAGYSAKPSIWNLTGKEQAALDGHEKWARENTFSPDGKTLFTGGSDDFVLERDWPSGKVRRKIELGRKGVEQMAVSGDGKRLHVMFWGEQQLSFYDLETGKLMPPPADAHRSDVYGIATAPDGSLVTFGRDEAVRTWNIKSGNTTDLLPVEMDLNAKGFALSADGRFVAVPKGDIDGIHIYDRSTKKLVRTIPAKHWSMKEIMFSPDGRLLASIGDGIVQVWEANTGKLVLDLKVEKVAYGVAGAFSPDSRSFCYSEHGIVRFLDTATWKEQPEWNGVYAPLGLACSPDGRMLATASVEGVRLFEVATRLERVHVRPNGYPSGGLRFSPNGRFLTWFADRSVVHVYDIWTASLLGPFSGHDDAVSGLTFTKDSRLLASSSGDSTILLWDIAGPAAAKKMEIDANIDESWQALAGDDAKAAFEAIRAMAASRDKSLKRIGERIKPAEPLNAEMIARLLKDLDSNVFAERERATRDLAELGERVVPHLEKFLASKPSAEARERVERIIKKLRIPDASAQVIQMRRALEVLERIGDDSSIKLLEIAAKGAEGATLTRDAQATLERLKKAKD